MPTWEIITPNGTKQTVTADSVITKDGGKTMEFFNNTDSRGNSETIALVTTGPGVVVMKKD